MLALLVLLLAVAAVLLFGVGLSVSSMLFLAAAIVIIWSAGAIVPVCGENVVAADLEFVIADATGAGELGERQIRAGRLSGTRWSGTR